MSAKKRPIALFYGLIAGLVLIGYSLLLYRLGLNAYLSNAARLAYIFLFVVSAAAALAEKKAMGGYLGFRSALKPAFTVMVVALALQTLGTFVLMNYIDNPFRKAVEEEELRRQVDWMTRWKFPQDQIDQTITNNKGVNQYTLSRSLQGLATAYVVFFVAALLIAAIVKKKKPGSGQPGLK